MFDVAVLPSGLRYCTSCIGRVSESDSSWFHVIGKVVAVEENQYPKEHF